MKGMPWFRLYHRMIDDDKMRLLAFEDRWHFVALCCLKAEGLLDEERSPIWHRRVAVKLGIQAREVEEMARRLREVGLIDEDMNPVAWDELQMRADHSTARVKAYRERQREQALTGMERSETVSETAQEKERDTEEEVEVEKKRTRARSKKDWVARPDDVSEVVWSAFVKVRKTAFTEIALQGFRREAAKAGWTLEAAITEAAERGWQGFKADWVKEKTNGRQQANLDPRDGLDRVIDGKLHARHASGPA